MQVEFLFLMFGNGEIDPPPPREKLGTPKWEYPLGNISAPTPPPPYHF